MSVEPSDEELLAGGRAEDFGALYERTYPLIRAHLRRRVGARPDLVLDLVAETFARALERREQFDPQRGPAVAWLLGIEPVAHAGRPFEHGGAAIGPAPQHTVIPPPLGLTGNTVSAITLRLGSLTCTIGFGAPRSTPCPASRPSVPLPQKPPHNLNEPLHLTLVKDTPAVCRAAFLNDPCYQVLLQFKAPYAITNAASEYMIETQANCANKPVASWSIDRDIKRGETVKELSTSSFNPSACAATETVQVRYQAASLAEAGSTQRPSIVGTASLRSASR